MARIVKTNAQAISYHETSRNWSKPEAKRGHQARTDNVEQALREVAMGRQFVALLVLLLGSALTPAASAEDVTGVPGAPGATTTIDGRYLPPPPQQFRGEINTNAAQSKPYWPNLVVPPKGAPNILLIMTDDVGFSAPWTFLFPKH